MPVSIILAYLWFVGPPAVQAQGSGPGPRYGHRAVWDSAHQMTVVFGGRGSNKLPRSDTWGWDGSRWHQLATGEPSSRAWVGLAYDQRREVVVLFGGRDSSQAAPADTWEWDGRQWRLAAGPSPEGPGPRDHAAMAYDPIHRGPAARVDHVTVYDPARKLAWLYGGYRPEEGGPVFGDLWSWDGRVWKCAAGC